MAPCRQNNLSFVSILLWVSIRNMSLFQIFPFVSGSMIYFLYFNEIYNEIYAFTLVYMIYLHTIILDQRKYDQRNLQSPLQTTPLTKYQCLALCVNFIFIWPKSEHCLHLPLKTRWLTDWYFGDLTDMSLADE